MMNISANTSFTKLGTLNSKLGTVFRPMFPQLMTLAGRVLKNRVPGNIPFYKKLQFTTALLNMEKSIT
jgi:hypothetical protein